MKKILSILLIVLYFTTLNTFQVYAEGTVITKKPMTFEEADKANGYTTFKKAAKQFEKRFNTRVILPDKIPFKVKHKFAKFYGDQAKVMFGYSGGVMSGNDLKITIFYKPEGSFTKDFNYKLNNGKMVSIDENPNPSIPISLSLKKSELEYFLDLSYKNKEIEKAKIIEIAESLTN